ncbi:MAG: alpha/beta hydrolase family esterase [Archangium sp.]
MRSIACAAVMFAACSGSPSRDGGLQMTDSGVGDSGVTPCGVSSPTSGRKTVGDREYLVHVPANYARVPTPVVFNFHGWNSNAEAQQSRSRMDTTADREGFIAVYPQGIGNSFNAGGSCCGPALDQDIDEAAFVRAMLDDLERELCVDRKRVYSTGMSNGGFLSYRFACEDTSLFAAIAPVAAIVSVPTCTPSRAMPVLHFHGTADAFVPIDGRPSLDPPTPSLEQTIDLWLQNDGCTGSPTVTFQNGDVTCEAWTNCDDGSEVEKCVIDGGGHTWPGGEPIPIFGKTTQDVSASDRMWEFFSRHSLP